MIAISYLQNACAGEAAPFEAQGKQAVARCAVLNSQPFPGWAKLFRAYGAEWVSAEVSTGK
jgi:hypothetical protein